MNINSLDMRGKTKMGKKGAFGGSLVLGIMLLNIVLYVFLLFLNQSETLNVVTTGTIEDGELSTIDSFSWLDGFKISVFGLPFWVDLFYVGFMGSLTIIGLWYSFKGG